MKRAPNSAQGRPRRRRLTLRLRAGKPGPRASGERPPVPLTIEPATAKAARLRDTRPPPRGRPRVAQCKRLGATGYSFGVYPPLFWPRLLRRRRARIGSAAVSGRAPRDLRAGQRCDAGGRRRRPPRRACARISSWTAATTNGAPLGPRRRFALCAAWPPRRPRRSWARVAEGCTHLNQIES